MALAQIRNREVTESAVIVSLLSRGHGGVARAALLEQRSRVAPLGVAEYHLDWTASVLALQEVARLPASPSSQD